MKGLIADFLNQIWTLLGMFVAWLVLEGSARTVVGYATLLSLAAWAITYPLRNPKEED